MTTFKQGTIEIASKAGIEEKLIEEVTRLLNSGVIDPESHNRAMVIGVALENIADNYLRGDRKTKEYKNLKMF